MSNLYKRLLVDLEFALIGVYVLGLVAALVTGEGVSRTFGIPPTFVMALGMSFGAVGYIATGLYFLIIFSLPIASIIVNRKSYLIMNVCLLVAAILSAWSFARFFLGALFP